MEYKIQPISAISTNVAYDKNKEAIKKRDEYISNTPGGDMINFLDLIFDEKVKLTNYQRQVLIHHCRHSYSYSYVYNRGFRLKMLCAMDKEKEKEITKDMIKFYKIQNDYVIGDLFNEHA